MSAIKRFFERKRLDKKFKRAGPGHNLASASSSAVSTSQPVYTPSRPTHTDLTEQQKRAAEAALSRATQSSTAVSSPRSANASIKAQAKRELEAERKAAQTAAHYTQGPQEVRLEAAKVVDACGGIFFTCDFLPNLMLPKKEMDEAIKQFLVQQKDEDAEMASALLIHTVNKNREKVRVCIETLCKYIDNILLNPQEEKFRKIRCSNKAFVERVKSIEGGPDFLVCSGYELKRLPFQDGEDEFLVISEESAQDKEKLNHLKEILTNAEPIESKLWRAARLFVCPTNAGTRFGEIPDEFYNISKEEIRREQQAKQEAVEKLGMLRTKAMKERDEIRELRRYRYTLIRVRFPQDIYLQAIFKATETLSNLKDYLREQLEYDWLPFDLLTSNGVKLTEDSKTLAEIQLVPACLIIFSYDKTLIESAPRQDVIKSSLLDRLENWSL